MYFPSYLLSSNGILDAVFPPTPFGFFSNPFLQRKYFFEYGDYFSFTLAVVITVMLDSVLLDIVEPLSTQYLSWNYRSIEVTGLSFIVGDPDNMTNLQY